LLSARSVSKKSSSSILQRLPSASPRGANGGDKHGTFHAQGGSIDFDRTAQTISGSIIVAAAGNDRSHGGSTIEVTGMFNLNGTAYEINVPVYIQIDGTNCVAKAQFP